MRPGKKNHGRPEDSFSLSLSHCNRQLALELPFFFLFFSSLPLTPDKPKLLALKKKKKKKKLPWALGGRALQSGEAESHGYGGSA